MQRFVLGQKRKLSIMVRKEMLLELVISLLADLLKRSMLMGVLSAQLWVVPMVSTKLMQDIPVGMMTEL